MSDLVLKELVHLLARNELERQLAADFETGDRREIVQDGIDFAGGWQSGYRRLYLLRQGRQTESGQQ
jgi:hypothetical protein